jgi:UDP-N-acetylmuramate dehydrogenase
VQIQQNIPLARFTTLNIGGPARFFARVRSEEELLEAVQFARKESLPIFPLGGGSNLLVADEGFPGLVLQVALGEDLAWTQDRTCIEAGAGLPWDALVDLVCEQGISGMECLAGIPGLVGGSPIQNIGAYGQEVSSVISGVRALDLHASHLDSMAFQELPASQLGFAYRSSVFNTTQKNRFLITRVDFALDPAMQPNLAYADLAPLRGTAPTPLMVAKAVRKIRAAKGMYLDPASPSPDHRSAGSFFKNPVVAATHRAFIARAQGIAEAEVPHWPTPSGQVKLPAAWLIEQAGFPKGFALGPVGISSRHTLALINRTGTASCEDLLRLRDMIVHEVQARFDIVLEQEPVMLS